MARRSGALRHCLSPLRRASSLRAALREGSTHATSAEVETRLTGPRLLVHPL
jgi:hypothetical protein